MTTAEVKRLSELIWRGETVEQEKGQDETSCHFQQLQQLFLENLCTLETTGTRSIEARIKSCNNNLERIRVVKECFRWIPLPQTFFQKLGKSQELSVSFRERGNAEFKSSKLSSALHGYNLAIAFARPREQELGLAFANRAAVLLAMEKPEEALKDIEYARENSFPQNLEVKLEERRNKCLGMISARNKRGQNNNNNNNNNNNSAPDQEQADNNNGGGIPRKRAAIAEYGNNEYFTLKSPSKSIVGAEAFVSIVDSEDRGRRVVVNEAVSAGSVLLVEKPFVSALDLELKWDAQHCQNCLKRVISGIPCEECTFSFYCNDQCRLEALGRFHRYEHQLWPYLHHIKGSQRDLLATRILEILGPSRLLDLFHQNFGAPVSEGSPTNPSTPPAPPAKEELPPQRKTAGFNTDGVYDSRTYEPVFQLVSHSQDQDELRDSVSTAFKAILLAQLLKEHSDFFNGEEMTKRLNNSSPEEREQQLLDFTASLILHHLENIPYNAISLGELRLPGGDTFDFKQGALSSLLLRNSGNSKKNENSIKSVSYASAIFPLLAMCNHSCCPNAIHVRSPARNETALVTLRSLRPGDEVCITYGPLFTVHEIGERKAILKEKYTFECDCEACVNLWPTSSAQGASNGNASAHPKLDFFEAELHAVHDLIEGGKWLEAIQRLRPCLHFFGLNFPQTFFLTQVAQDLFKKALIFILNY